MYSRHEYKQNKTNKKMSNTYSTKLLKDCNNIKKLNIPPRHNNSKIQSVSRKNRGKMYAPKTHIHDPTLCWFCTGTSIKLGWLLLFYGPKSPLPVTLYNHESIFLVPTPFVRLFGVR